MALQSSESQWGQQLLIVDGEFFCVMGEKCKKPSVSLQFFLAKRE